MNEEYQHMIDRYLGGELSSEELVDFEKELKVNLELKDQLEFIRSTKDAIKVKDFDVKLDFIKGLEEIEGETNLVPFRLLGKRLYWISGLAASVLLVSFFFWNTNRQEEIRKQRIIDEYFVHVESGVSAKRSNTDPIVSLEKLEAFNLYELKDYDMAVPKLLEVYLNEGDTTSLYYACLASIGSGSFLKALELSDDEKLSVQKRMYIKAEVKKLEELINQ